ncbi:hypothetical protein E2C01_040595 [Portunus trituberculatus]|uniref:Uncharacterized protein n=1 Tax=Portunus trituberculatus TaxID=210409 RepID=A0A5B7FN22_PORTR|nr:hypothetical protein [Portunus trituberculatus]
MCHHFDTESVQFLDMRHHGREQFSHPGDTSHEGMLVLTTKGAWHLYDVTTTEHHSRAPCGDS